MSFGRSASKPSPTVCNTSRRRKTSPFHARRGSLRDAQSALDQVLAFAGPDAAIDENTVREALGLIGAALTAEAVDALDAADPAAMLRLVARLARGGYDLRQFLRALASYVRHLLVAQVVGLDRELLPLAESELGLVERQCRRFTTADLTRVFSVLTELEAQARSAEDPRPLVEVGLVQLTQLGRLRPLEEILARLDALAGKPAGNVKAPPSKPSLRAGEPPRRPASPAVERPAPRLAPPPEPPLEEPPPEADAVEEQTFDCSDPEALLARLKALAEKNNRTLLSVHLDAVKTARWQGNDFELIFGTSSKEKEAESYVANSSEKIRLRDWLRQLTGKTVNVVTRLERDRTPTPLSEPEAQTAALRAEAERHPTVRMLQKTFGAELLEVRPPEA